MKISAFCAIALAMSVSAFGQTSAPAAPTLTAGAEFKGLRLDWDAVGVIPPFQPSTKCRQLTHVQLATAPSPH